MSDMNSEMPTPPEPRFDAQALFSQGVKDFVPFGSTKEAIQYRALDVGKYWIGAMHIPAIPEYDIYLQSKAVNDEGKHMTCHLTLTNRHSDPEERKIRKKIKSSSDQLPDILEFDADIAVAGGAGSHEPMTPFLDKKDQMQSLASSMKESDEQEEKPPTEDKDKLDADLDPALEEELSMLFEKTWQKTSNVLANLEMAHRLGLNVVDDDVAIQEVVNALSVLSQKKPGPKELQEAEQLIQKALPSLLPGEE